jgi:diketogulonate reductase-like aldo/keto reductase
MGRSPRTGSGRNIDIFDFGLSAEEVEAISALNRNERTGPDPDRFDGS